MSGTAALHAGALACMPLACSSMHLGFARKPHGRQRPRRGACYRAQGLVYVSAWENAASAMEMAAVAARNCALLVHAHLVRLAERAQAAGPAGGDAGAAVSRAAAHAGSCGRPASARAL